MTAFDYDAARADAEGLLADFGQTGAIRRTVITGGDPWNPDSGTETVTDYPCTLVVEPEGFSEREIDGTLVKTGDKKVLVSTSGLTIEPQVSDKIVIETVAHTIGPVNPMNPAGTIIMWTLAARV